MLSLFKNVLLFIWICLPLPLLGAQANSNVWCIDSCNQESCSNPISQQYVDNCSNRYVSGRSNFQRTTGAMSSFVMCSSGCRVSTCPDCTNRGEVEPPICRQENRSLPFYNRLSTWSEVTPSNYFEGYQRVNCECTNQQISQKSVQDSRVDQLVSKIQNKMLEHYARLWKKKIESQIAFERQFLKGPSREQYGCFTTPRFQAALNNYISSNPNCDGKSSRIQQIMSQVIPGSSIKDKNGIFPALDAMAKASLSDQQIPGSCLSESQFQDLNDNPALHNLSSLYGDFIQNARVNGESVTNLISRTTGTDNLSDDIYSAFMEYSKNSVSPSNPALLYINQFGYGLVDALKFVVKNQREGRSTNLVDFIRDYNASTDREGNTHKKNLYEMHQDFCLYSARDLSSLICTNDMPSILDYSTAQQVAPADVSNNALLLDQAFCRETRYFEGTSRAIEREEANAIGRYRSVTDQRSLQRSLTCTPIEGAAREVLANNILVRAHGGATIDSVVAELVAPDVCLRDRGAILDKIMYLEMSSTNDSSIITQARSLRTGVDRVVEGAVGSVIDTRFRNYQSTVGTDDSQSAFRNSGIASFRQFNYSNLLYSKLNEFRNFVPINTTNSPNCLQTLNNLICGPINAQGISDKASCVSGTASAIMSSIRGARSGDSSSLSAICHNNSINASAVALVSSTVQSVITSGTGGQCRVPETNIFDEMIHSTVEGDSLSSASAPNIEAPPQTGREEALIDEEGESIFSRIADNFSNGNSNSGQQQTYSPYTMAQAEEKITEARTAYNNVMPPNQQLSSQAFDELLKSNNMNLPSDATIASQRGSLLNEAQLAEIQRLRQELASMRGELEQRDAEQRQRVASGGSNGGASNGNSRAPASIVPGPTSTSVPASSGLGGSSERSSRDDGNFNEVSLRSYTPDESSVMNRAFEQNGEKWVELSRTEFGQIENNRQWMLANLFNVSNSNPSDCRDVANKTVFMNIVDSNNILTYKFILRDDCQIEKTQIAQTDSAQATTGASFGQDGRREFTRYSDLLRVINGQ